MLAVFGHMGDALFAQMRGIAQNADVLAFENDLGLMWAW